MREEDPKSPLCLCRRDRESSFFSLCLKGERQREVWLKKERERVSVFFFSQEGGVTALTGTALSVSVELNERGLFYCIAESLS